MCPCHHWTDYDYKNLLFLLLFINILITNVTIKPPSPQVPHPPILILLMIITITTPLHRCHTHPTRRGDWDYCSPYPRDQVRCLSIRKHQDLYVRITIITITITAFPIPEIKFVAILIQNIARIANAVQVTIFLLVSTSVY